MVCNSVIQAVKSILNRSFACDLRSLALFRIALAAVTIAHIAVALPYLTDFFTDTGVWPSSLAKSYNSYGFSFHTLGNTVEFQTALAVVFIFSCLCMMVGYKTRFFTFVCWVFLVSLQTRNWSILQAGDRLHVMLMFWAIFLPLGARFSVDAAFHKTKQLTNHIVNVSTIAVMLQAISVYFFTALAKDGIQWSDGTAVYYALMGDFALPTAQELLPYTDFMSFLSYSVWYFEIGLVLLLLSPVLQTYTRLATMAGLVVMHLSFGHFLHIGLFPYDSMTSLIPFLPAAVWNWLGKKRSLAAVTSSGEWVTKYFGWLPWPLKPSKPTLRLYKAVQLFLWVMIAHMLFNNVTEVSDVSYPKAMKDMRNQLRIGQAWFMFAPQAGGVNDWLEVVGELEDGTKVDARRMKLEPPTMDKPVNIALDAGDNRWLKYYQYVPKSKRTRVQLAKYLCRKWDEAFPDKPLQRVKIYHITQYTVAPGNPYEAVRQKKRMLRGYACGD